MTNDSDRNAGRWMLVFAVLWLVFLGAFAFGAMTIARETWPYGLLRSAWTFVRGDDEDTTTLADRVGNDLGLRPARHVLRPERPFPVPDHYRALEGLDLKGRRAAPLVHLSEDAPRGFRLIHGTFDFEGGLHGAVLLDPAGVVRQRWVLRQDDVDWAERRDENVNPHGIDILPDGSLVAAFDVGSSLARYGYCGEVLWRLRGGFHHSVTLAEDGTLWTWGDPSGRLIEGLSMLRVRVADGTLLQHIALEDVLRANPDIDPLGIRQKDRRRGPEWLFDPYHPNDVDPLPERLARAYPDFEAGDLLVSLRSLNLVAVIDPDSLAIKWWRQGLTRRQHDPDWNDRGTITVFDNNMHRAYSRIQEIDPRTFEARIVVPGAPHAFYTWQRGKHDPVPGGGFLIASTEQGRLFEVDAGGRIVFDFINRYGDASYLSVSEGRFLPPGFFEELPECES